MTLDYTYQHILKTCKTLTIKEILCRLLEFNNEGLYSHINNLSFDYNEKTNSYCNSQFLDNIKDKINYELRTFDLNSEILVEIFKNNDNKKITKYTKIRDIVEEYYLEKVCDDLSCFVASDNFYNYLLELITGKTISEFTDDELEQGGDSL